MVTPPLPAPLENGFNREFDGQFANANISGFLDQDKENTVSHELLRETCELYLRHLRLPKEIDAVVKSDPNRKKPSLHARLSFTFRSEGDREQQYCFRILGHTNAIAFQSHLKAAMTASGIDTVLKFRHLFILRRGDPPSGPKTKALVDQFLNAGGIFIA